MVSSVSAAVRSVFAPFNALRDCPPDCRTEYLCATDGRYYARECCYRPNCTYYCGSWVQIGSC